MAKYYTLLQKISGNWEEVFGDYDKDCVKYERQELVEYGIAKKEVFKIIKTSDHQDAIEAKIAELNA